MTARDIRYGRRGGGWLPPARTDPAACHTCRNGDARYLARHTQTGEQWPICGRCRGQVEKFSAPITIHPLDLQETA